MNSFLFDGKSRERLIPTNSAEVGMETNFTLKYLIKVSCNPAKINSRIGRILIPTYSLPLSHTHSSVRFRSSSSEPHGGLALNLQVSLPSFIFLPVSFSMSLLLCLCTNMSLKLCQVSFYSSLTRSRSKSNSSASPGCYHALSGLMLWLINPRLDTFHRNCQFSSTCVTFKERLSSLLSPRDSNMNSDSNRTFSPQTSADESEYCSAYLWIQSECVIYLIHDLT